MKIKFKSKKRNKEISNGNQKKLKKYLNKVNPSSKPQVVYDLGASNLYGLSESFTDDEESLLLISPSYDIFPSAREELLGKARKQLYMSHFAAKGTEVIWQFCLVLFLMAITGYQSMALVSSYGLFTGLVVCLGSSVTGKLVDSRKYSRFEITRMLIWIQNLSVVFATVCFFFLLRMVNEVHITPDMIQRNRFGGSNIQAGKTGFLHLFEYFVPPVNPTSLILLLGIHIFGAVAKLADQTLTVAIERDWIVVMSEVAVLENDDEDEFDVLTSPRSLDSQHSYSTFSVGQVSFGASSTLNKTMLQKMKKETWLSQTNTSMTQIDLFCQFVGPAIAGLYVAIFDDANPSNAIEVEISHWYNLSYAAAFIGFLNLISLFVEYRSTKSVYESIHELSERGDASKSTPRSCSIFQLPTGLSIYLKQPIAAGGVSLALL